MKNKEALNQIASESHIISMPEPFEQPYFNNDRYYLRVTRIATGIATHLAVYAWRIDEGVHLFFEENCEYPSLVIPVGCCIVKRVKEWPSNQPMP